MRDEEACTTQRHAQSATIATAPANPARSHKGCGQQLPSGRKRRRRLLAAPAVAASNMSAVNTHLLLIDVARWAAGHASCWKSWSVEDAAAPVHARMRAVIWVRTRSARDAQLAPLSRQARKREHPCAACGDWAWAVRLCRRVLLALLLALVISPGSSPPAVEGY